MAVVTTLCMPPLLRWALARVPTRDEEKARMETEAAEEKDLLPKVKRILVGLDASESGRRAAALAGWLIGARHLTATVVDLGNAGLSDAGTSAQSRSVLETAETAARAVEILDIARIEGRDEKRDEPVEPSAKQEIAERVPVRDLISFRTSKEPPAESDDAIADAILAEVKNGYDFLILGLDMDANGHAAAFPPALVKIVRGFSGPVAVFLIPTGRATPPATSLARILVPMIGTDYSRLGAEVAVAIARGCGGTITALHVSPPPTESELLRHPAQLRPPGRALLADIVALGQRQSARVVTKALVRTAKETVILREAALGGHQLIVIGTKAWSGGELHFGQSAQALIAGSPCPVLLLKS
jgi:nucleotide-binding universal stress UspA family protein